MAVIVSPAPAPFEIQGDIEMWDIEEIFIATLFGLLVLFNPITVATVIYISRKTEHHRASLLIGALVYVLSIALASILLVADEFSFEGLVAVFEYTRFSDVVAGTIYFIFIAPWGIGLSAAVLLRLSQRRHYPTRLPARTLWLVITAYSLILCASLFDWGSCQGGEDSCTENMVDDLSTRSATFLESWWQGDEVEFNGYKIYLDSTYLYTRDGEKSLTLDKINPEYNGTSYWVIFAYGANEEVSKLERQCLDEASTCVTVERDGYLEFTLTSTDPGPGIAGARLFYHPECEVYILPYSYLLTDDRYSEYIEQFFSDNCSGSI